MRRALQGLSLTPQHVLIDGRRLRELSISQQPIIKGDARSMSIAAASDPGQDGARDALMYKLDVEHLRLWLRAPQGLPCPGARGCAQASRRSRRSIAALSHRSVRCWGYPRSPPWPDKSRME